MRTPLRLLLPLVLASACASANAPAPQSEVLTMDENGALIRHTVDENARASVAATPDRIWQALLATYADLSVQPTDNDRAQWRYGNMGFLMPSQLKGRSRNEFLRCSAGAAGMGNYGRITAQLYSQLTPESPTATTLVTHFSGLLRSNEGTSASAPLRCSSTGVLEEYIRKEVERRLMTIP